MAKSNPSFTRFHIRTADPERAERAVAEVFAAGARGLEEREVEDGVELVIYAEREAAADVQAVIAAIGLDCRAIEAVPDEDWSEAWRRNLCAIEISNRLVVRPSFVDFAAAPGQRELVVDPGQAFGTGSHESTRLALEWIADLAPRLGPRAAVLDVGCGTGVLALAAVALSGARGIGFDVDRLAAPAARENARSNGLEARTGWFTGVLSALASEARFDLVAANLLRSELEPILPAVAARVAPRGSAVLSGLLEGEADRITGLAAERGLVSRGVRRRVDASGVAWIALCMGRSD